MQYCLSKALTLHFKGLATLCTVVTLCKKFILTTNYQTHLSIDVCMNGPIHNTCLFTIICYGASVVVNILIGETGIVCGSDQLMVIIYELRVH